MATLSAGRTLGSRFLLALRSSKSQSRTGLDYGNLLHHQQSRTFIRSVGEPGAKTRLVLLGSGALLASAFITHGYENWRLSRTNSDILKTNKLWDSERGQFKDSQFSLIKQSGLKMDEIAAIPVSKHIDGPTVLAGNLGIKLFQFGGCPYCRKTRAFLDYYGLKYDVVEVNSVLRSEIKFAKPSRKVPIVVLSPNGKKSNADDKTHSALEKPMQVTDSTLIISLLATYMLANEHQETIDQIADLYQTTTYSNDDNTAEVVNKYFILKGDTVSSPDQKAVVNELALERKWRAWADDVLVHTLSPNVYRTMDEAIETFHVFSINGDWDQLWSPWSKFLAIYVGSTAMWMISKSLKKKYRLKDDVRESLYDACRQWTRVVGHNAFLGGDRPNLADISVYGVLSSIEGCQAFDDALANTKIGNWYYRTKKAIANHEGHKFLPTDKLHPKAN